MSRSKVASPVTQAKQHYHKPEQLLMCNKRGLINIGWAHLGLQVPRV